MLGSGSAQAARVLAGRYVRTVAVLPEGSAPLGISGLVVPPRQVIVLDRATRV
jgi:hypothetical protein